MSRLSSFIITSFLILFLLAARQAMAQDITLTVTPDPVPVFSQVTVSWTSTTPRPNDVIKMYVGGYTPQVRNAGTGTSGSVQFFVQDPGIKARFAYTHNGTE